VANRIRPMRCLPSSTAKSLRPMARSFSIFRMAVPPDITLPTALSSALANRLRGLASRLLRFFPLARPVHACRRLRMPIPGCENSKAVFGTYQRTGAGEARFRTMN
jgi:hypothetical protein